MRSWTLAVALLVAALAGPWLTGSAPRPAAAASAARLLPPLAWTDEARLEVGGYLRAEEIRQLEAGVEVIGAGQSRFLSGVVLGSPVRQRRMWLGTDAQGRDLLARVAGGGRRAVLIALPATLLASFLALVLGMLRALGGRFADRGVGLLTDGALGLPTLLVLLVLASALADQAWGLVVAVAAVSCLGPSRLVYQRARGWMASPAAWSVQASGAGVLRTTTIHLLPAMSDVGIAAAPLVFAQAVLIEATLSFLGVGGGAADSWGSLISEAGKNLPESWWQVAAPGVLILVLTTTFHATGTALNPDFQGANTEVARSPRVPRRRS